MIGHELSPSYEPELDGDELIAFVQRYEAGDSWPKLRKLTGLSKYRLENLVMFYNLGQKTSFYKRKIEGRAVEDLRNEDGDLYLNMVDPRHIANEHRHLYA